VKNTPRSCFGMSPSGPIANPPIGGVPRLFLAAVIEWCPAVVYDLVALHFVL
jgi:hypothetical protein